MTQLLYVPKADLTIMVVVSKQMKLLETFPFLTEKNV